MDFGGLGSTKVREAHLLIEGQLKKKGFKEDRVTTMGLDAIGPSPTLESNKSL